jgi:hypothetical protein
VSGLTWHADAILARVRAAEVAAIDETTAACVPRGRRYVNKDTHLLESRIASIPATETGGVVSGAYGVPDDPGYALPQEYLPSPQGNSYIRRAAAEEFPQLGGRIAERLR